jgi:hypothetical protein
VKKNIHCNNNNWAEKKIKLKNKNGLIKLRGKAKTWVRTGIGFI